MFNAQNATHETQGMSIQEKIARCRQWLPGGKFLHEAGSGFRTNPLTRLELWRIDRIEGRRI